VDVFFVYQEEKNMKNNVPMIIRRSQLKTIVGVSPSTIDRLEAQGSFPRRKRFSEGCVGWYGPDVCAWAEKLSKEGGGV
jgi:predicted DNA-binding transcriptional regulator AlpA